MAFLWVLSVLVLLYDTCWYCWTHINDTCVGSRLSDGHGARIDCGCDGYMVVQYILGACAKWF